MVSAFGVALVFIVLVCSVASGFLDESERLQKDTTAPDSVQAVTTDRDVPAMPRTIHISGTANGNDCAIRALNGTLTMQRSPGSDSPKAN